MVFFLRLSPLLLVLPLAACTSAEPDMGLTSSGMASSAALMPQTTAAAIPVGVTLPPEAGPVLSSSERAGPESRLRRTVLRGDGALPGENFVSVETGGTKGKRTGLLRPPTVEQLQVEMRAAVPGIPMRLGATMEANASGPFGYALGGRDGTNCIYAWQWLDFGGQRGFLKKRDPADIRVRLCRRADAGALLASVRAMRFGAGGDDGILDAGLSGTGSGDALAATGVPVGTGAVADTTIVSLAAEEAGSAAPAPRRKTRAPANPPAAALRSGQVIEADAPEIPLPDAGGAAHAGKASASRRKTLPPAQEADDDAPLIPDPGTTAATR